MTRIRTKYVKSDYKRNPNLTQYENNCRADKHRHTPMGIICEHGNKITLGFVTECWDMGADISIEGCEKCAEKWNLTEVHEEDEEDEE